MLLYRGGSDVISSSRVSWMSGTDRSGIPYHFYHSLLQDTMTSLGIIGNAYDIANVIFMNNCGFWLPVYHYNIFGDPALQQYGRIVAIAEHAQPRATSMFTVFPNPSKRVVTIEFSAMPGAGTAITIHDASGRLIRQYDYQTIRLSDHLIWCGNDQEGRKVPAGVYFVTYNTGDRIDQEKVVVLN
jgi:hypothetical protein